MATTTYSVDYDGAKLLYRWAGEDRSWVRRLEDMKGTEEDARQAIRIFDQLGKTSRADGLRSMLPLAPEVVAERRKTLDEQRLELHGNDIIDALPDDPEEAVILLTSILTDVIRSSLDIPPGPIPSASIPRLHAVTEKVCEALRVCVNLDTTA